MVNSNKNERKVFVRAVQSSCWLMTENALLTTLREVTAAQPQSSLVVKAPAARRVPAEWEPQEAIWLHMARRLEKAFLRRRPLRLEGVDHAVRKIARALSISGGASPASEVERLRLQPHHDLIAWHDIPYDSAWMRDNGPVFAGRPVKCACKTGNSTLGAPVTQRVCPLRVG